MGSFINPYTFIPVHDGSKKSLREYYNSHANLISGKIECTLFTRSQIAICDKVSDSVFDFFNVNGKPLIPGSSLRGTVRSLYEALTDSCFSSTNAEDDDFFSSRFNKDKCGLLSFENGEYILYRAQRYKDRNNSQVHDLEEGDRVTFTSYQLPGSDILYFKNVQNGNKAGYVHKVNRFKGRIKGKPVENLDSIFEKAGRNGTKIDKAYIERLEVNVSMSDKKPKGYEKLLEEMKKGKAILPVWYCKSKDGHYYFAPSQMSRAVFYNKPIDLLRNKHLDKCSDINNICDACALFGTVNDGGFALSSRVRFGDAVCVTPDCLDKSYILDVLGAPRLSSFEFYLKSEKDSYTADSAGVEIAGRKYYWHNQDIASHPIDKDAAIDNDNLKRSVQLVRKGSEFRFTVYFDRITEDQLRKLVFTLNLGENRSDSKQCHKVGHGKPLGLGSAKIVCDRITVRKFEYPEYIEKDMTGIIGPDLRNAFENQANVDNVLKVTNIYSVEGKISYPYVNERSKVFEWFAKNRDNFKSIGIPLKYKQKLPELSAETQALSSFPPDDRGSGTQKNNGNNKGGAAPKNQQNSRNNDNGGGIRFGGIRIKGKK